MQSLIIRSATAALFAAALAPAAFAQSASRAEPAYNPYAGAGGAAVCTQLELSVGLTGDECGAAIPSPSSASSRATGTTPIEPRLSTGGGGNAPSSPLDFTRTLLCA